MDSKQVITGLVPSKKHKSSHRHSDGHSGKSSSKKQSKSKASSSSHLDSTKSVTLKKETTPIKKKPMISESDSEDDIPLAVQKSVVKEEIALPEPGHGSTPGQGSTPSKVKVKTEKRSNHTNGNEIPLAKRKPGPMPSLGATHPSHPDNIKTTSPLKPLPDKVKTESKPHPLPGTKRKASSESEEGSDSEEKRDDDEDFKPSSAKKPKKAPVTHSKKPAVAKKIEKVVAISPPLMKKKSKVAKKNAVKTSHTKGGRKKKEEEEEVFKWWEKEPHPDGIKWMTLEHKGPYFAPPYEPLPPEVQFVYAGEPMKLSNDTEEAAGFFSKMLDHDYTTKDIFCNNFFQDWRKEMTEEEAAVITDFKKCDFTQIHQYYKERSEARKNMTKEEKLALKAENEKIIQEYGWCVIDGHKERIGNFKIEPPGLFRGRGDHPKQGKIKKRIEAEDVQINIGKDAEIPVPPPGHKWKLVQHDNKVTWLASWTENIQGAIKYVMLSPTSRLKGEKDWAKYETARRLKDHVDNIRAQYREDWKSKEMRVRQRAVAVYFIDKLALRAGNEKDSDESADTVGCCSLRVEHINLHEEKDGKEHVIEFDFLGKDSIRYYNCVPVEKQVFKNVRLFMKEKEGVNDLFDRLTTSLLNKHLSELMEGLTAKVFRTYNASKTLQDQLNELTVETDSIPSKILSYNRANRAVAILCNHQRAPPKTFNQQMSNLQSKIQSKEDLIIETKAEVKALKKEARTTKDSKTIKRVQSKQNQLARLEEQLLKLEVQATDKQENKEIALGTSKLNYLDPRISVAWCKKWDVPLEKVYNKTQRQKFAWAIDMAEEDFQF